MAEAKESKIKANLTGFKGAVTLANVISQLDIVELLSEFIKIERKGKQTLALCPFHPDKNPSLNIDINKKLFYCFSCQKGGNLLTFLQLFNNWSPRRARAWILARAGFDNLALLDKPKQILKPEKAYTQAQKEIADFNKKFLETSCLFMAEAINKDYKLQEFFQKRGFNFEILAKFKIGFLPEEALSLLEKHDFTRESLIIFGYLHQLKQPSFLPRILFPIINLQGDPVGFVFRSLSFKEDIKNDPKTSLARYINSPENALFRKREWLFNLPAILDPNQDNLYLVEGIFDVFALNRLGFKQTLALLGVNLSKEQISFLKDREVILALDNDEAGREASLKIALQLASNQISFRIVRPRVDLPKDWDEYLNLTNDQELVIAVLKDSIALADYLYHYLALNNPETPSELNQLLLKLKNFLPYITKLEADWLIARFTTKYNLNRNLLATNLGLEDSTTASPFFSQQKRTYRRGFRRRRAVPSPPPAIANFPKITKKTFWGSKINFWEGRILKALLVSQQLREYFSKKYDPKKLFQRQQSLRFWDLRLSADGDSKLDLNTIPADLLELEAELKLIKDFPDSEDKLDQLIENLTKPVARHLSKQS